MNLNQMPFNVFDVILAAVLLAGVLRGRKHGMSEELMGMIKWLLIVVCCGWFYQPAGQWLATFASFSLLWSYIFVYVVGAALILAFFALIKHQIGGKLIGSDIFGKSEYYLGMGSGLVRFACMLIAGLALLNAPYTSPAEVRAMEAYQDDMYGANYFPTLHTAQAVVFDDSLSGPWIRDHLGFLLITPTASQNKAFHLKDAQVPY
jgi:uncharacterized membrane protein required for colicin V production